jgi:hypothetical protein
MMREEYLVPESNTDETVEFIDRMFPRMLRHLVAIPLRGRLEAASFHPGEDNQLRRWIEVRQREDNIFFHVNELKPGFENKKATKKDVSAALFVHVDIDDPHAEERLLTFSPPPTVILFSGGGYHGYWKLAEATDDLLRVEAINMTVAKALGGDNCHNIDRIMRLPGTVNLPNTKKQKAGRKPTLARIVRAEWSLTYSLDDFPQEEGPKPPDPKGAVAQDPPTFPVTLEDLPLAVSPVIHTLIENGDDPERPRSGPNPRHPSRSHSVFASAHALARAGCDEAQIAGILINPQYGISASVLDKRNSQAYALRQARRALSSLETGWVETERSGKPKPTLPNTLLALSRLDLTFAYDRFQYRKMVNGTTLQEFQGELSDDAVAMIRALILETFKFDPRAENVRDAVNQFCLENSFHPIRDMLAGLSWDRTPRIDTWLVDYLGAEDTPLNRTIGPIILIAAVRRVRQPGVKFDQIPVLEGVQGSGKSTALRTLAGEGFHSDQEILTQEARTQMELLEGVWFYELGEVEGLNRAEVNKIKAFASRQEDRSRMAYGRFIESRPRQAIFIGTTNETSYLRDQTGNRRFWPIKTGTIDLERLRRDRDLLLAEAAYREQQGESIMLSPSLWDAAAVEQAERLEEDPWLERLAKEKGKAYGNVVRVETGDLLAEVLSIPLERQNQGHGKRLATLMRKLGWEPAKFRVGGSTVRGYERHKPEDHIDAPGPKF